MKGDSAAAVLIIVLIIIGIVALFYFYGGGFFSGIIGQQTIVYSNDVIQISDKLVSDSEPYAGQKTTIEFTVKNAGDKDVKGVSVELEPPTGFTSEVKCGEKSSCNFDLQRGDSVDAVITLTAIPKDKVTQLIPVTVRYSVKYPYSGEREIHIPIVSNKNDLPKGQSFFVSEPTFGPVQVQITPPDARQAPDGSTSVYAIGGARPVPIELGFSVQEVGSSFYGSVEPLVMQGDDFKLVLDSNFKPLHCDNIDTEKGSGNSFPLKVKSLGSQQIGIEVPFDVACTIEPAAQKLTDGVIKINYNYVYKISFSDIFVILPTTIPPIEAPTTPSGATGGGTGGGAAGTQTISGKITTPGGTNLQQFEIVGGAKYFVRANAPFCIQKGQDLELKIYLSTDKSVFPDHPDTSTVAGCKGVDYNAPTDTKGNNIRYVFVTGPKDWSGDYTLEVTNKAAAPKTETTPTEPDAPNDISQALSLGKIQGTATRSNSIEPPGDKDYYSFEMETNKRYTIKTTGCEKKGGADTYLKVYLKLQSGAPAVIGEDNDSGLSGCSSVTIQPLSNNVGTRYVEITGAGGSTGTYSLEITAGAGSG